MSADQLVLGNEQTLASGAMLRIQLAPFAIAKALHQAMLREVRYLEVTTIGDVEILLIKMFALGFSSQAVENCLWACFERCTYNGSKIDKDTFEPEASREDYIKVCVEVARANVGPFMKSLFVAFQTGMGIAANALQSSQQTMT